MRNGQNVVVFAPRRYGKSSLVLRAARRAAVAGRGARRLLRPDEDADEGALRRCARAHDLRGHRHARRPAGRAGGVGSSAGFGSGRRWSSIRAPEPAVQLRRVTAQANRRHRRTIERLLELPQDIANERRRRAVLMLDEFQEIVKLDKAFPNLIRAVFQTQPEVGHIYLGSKRHIIDKIFDDKNEAFWRAPRGSSSGGSRERFTPFIKQRFERPTRGSATRPSTGSSTRRGAPVRTQQLAYMTWGSCRRGTMGARGRESRRQQSAPRRAQPLREDLERRDRDQRLLILALAAEPSGLYGIEYQERYGLASDTHIQRQ